MLSDEGFSCYFSLFPPHLLPCEGPFHFFQILLYSFKLGHFKTHPSSFSFLPPLYRDVCPHQCSFLLPTPLKRTDIPARAIHPTLVFNFCSFRQPDQWPLPGSHPDQICLLGRGDCVHPCNPLSSVLGGASLLGLVSWFLCLKTLYPAEIPVFLCSLWEEEFPKFYLSMSRHSPPIRNSYPFLYLFDLTFSMFSGRRNVSTQFYFIEYAFVWDKLWIHNEGTTLNSIGWWPVSYSSVTDSGLSPLLGVTAHVSKNVKAARPEHL